MAGNFEIIVDDTRSLAAVKAVESRGKLFSQFIADKAAAEASKTMRFLVPRGRDSAGDGEPETVFERIGWTKAVYHPGGAGGGGQWIAAAGVRRSPLHPDPDRDPAVLIIRGTGIHGPHGTPIIPRSGNFLVFEWKGQKIFTKHAKGQEPNRLWVDAAQERANAVVASAIAEMDRHF